MTAAARLAAATGLLAAAALTVASLALADVVPAWGVLFFYVLPTLFFAVWSAREFAPDAWRRTMTPLRRGWRSSRLSSPGRVADLPPPPQRPAKRPKAERVESVADLFAAAARGWLRLMRTFLQLLRSRRTARILNLVFGVAALALTVLVVRELRRTGWPLDRADPAATAAAAALFLSTFAIRAVAWQRLFRPFERPRSLALVSANGTAAVAALALPSRIDDAIAVGVVRRLGRPAPSIGTLVLSLFLLGLMDIAALTPFAAYSAVAAPASGAVRIGIGIVAGMGVGAGILAAALPFIERSERLVRYRLGHWLAVHAPASRHDAVWAWLLVAVSWLTRAGGVLLLLDAVGLAGSFAVATSYVAAAAAAATLPIGPGGAATQAGVGVAVLVGAGIDTPQAVALAVGTQALTVAAGGAFAALGGLVYVARLRGRAT